MASLPIIQLSVSAISVKTLSDLVNVDTTAFFDHTPCTSTSIREQLNALWSKRQIHSSPPLEARYHWDTVGGYPTIPCTLDQKVPTGASIFKVKDSVVIPTHNYLISNGSVVAEKYGRTCDVYETFLTRYSSYFHFDSATNSIDLPYLIDETFPRQSDSVNLDDKGIIPVLLSNHLHDRVYNHWFYNNLYALYLFNRIRHGNKFLFVFSYKPLDWQLQTIQYYFGFHATYAVISGPTRFHSIYFASFRSNAFLDGDYLGYLYGEGDNRKRRFNCSRLYISRKDSKNRKIVNERELHSILLSLGFYPVAMSEFSFEDQISLVSSAADIIFIAGSSGMNLLHAANSCKISIISFNEPDPWKEILANFGLFNVERFIADLVPNEEQFDISVDVNKFKEFLDYRHPLL